MPGSETAPPVQIILGTYNGAQWLDELFISIRGQDYADWELLIRDDGSSDDTVALLEKWHASGMRMSFLPDSGLTNLGAKDNCTALLAASTALYVIFAGQDDVWLPDRLTCTVDAFRQAEDKHGVSIPLVVCADAKVVDSQLRPVASSWWQWARINPARINRATEVVMEGPGLGASLAVNRAMIDFALPIPHGYHDADSWLTLVAVAFGRLIVNTKPVIFYRRHDQNVSDIPFGGSLMTALFRFLKTPRAPRVRLHNVLLKESVPQAAAFANHYRDHLPLSESAGLDALAKLESFGFFKRRWTFLRYNLWYGSIIKNIGLLIFL